MCIGESGADSLGYLDRAVLRDAVHQFPDYDFRLHRNEDDLTWVVLSPSACSQRTPQFTFCRIDACVVVMVEDQTSQRRFCSAPTIEDAVHFALASTKRAVLAFDNVHEAPEMAQ